MVFFAENLQFSDRFLLQLAGDKGWQGISLMVLLVMVPPERAVSFSVRQYGGCLVSFGILIFCLSYLASLASNGGGLSPFRVSGDRPVFLGFKCLNRRSLSQMMRTATDWTRPALNPPLLCATTGEKSGIPPGGPEFVSLSGLHICFVEFFWVFDGFKNRIAGQFVKQHPVKSSAFFFRTSAAWKAMASPSRSGSGAR